MPWKALFTSMIHGSVAEAEALAAPEDYIVVYRSPFAPEREFFATLPNPDRLITVDGCIVMRRPLEGGAR